MDYQLTLLTEFKDNITNKIKPVISAMEKMKRNKKTVHTTEERDRASSKIEKIRSRIRLIKDKTAMVKADITNAVSKVNAIKSKFTAIKDKIVPIKVQDKASPVLQGIKGKLASLAAGVTFTAIAKMAIEGIGQEQTQKITINRVFENAGQSKKQAQKSANQYYKYLEEYANKTPFSTQSVAQFGTKARLISKGDMGQAKEITGLMGNVKAFVGDMRTEQEVAEAFFSASNGNLEMLNNMLGSQYKTFEEAKNGIAQNQGGLVDEMSKTLPGAISTLQGVVQVGVKNLFAPFSTEATSTISKLSEIATMVTPVLSEGLSSIMSSLSPIGEMFNGFLDSIINKSPETMGIFSIFGTLITTVFQMIGSTIQAVSPIITRIFNFIGQNAGVITSAIQLLGRIWQGAWQIIGTALKLAWSIIKPPLDTLSQMLITIRGAIDALRDAWSRAMNFIKNNPITATINKVFSGGDEGPGHASGLARVPYDNYKTRLHEGEMVLSRREADEYRNGGIMNGVTFNKIADTIVVREEADIDKIINGINKKVKLAKAGGV